MASVPVTQPKSNGSRDFLPSGLPTSKFIRGVNLTTSAELSQRLYRHPDAIIRLDSEDDIWLRRVAKASLR